MQTDTHLHKDLKKTAQTIIDLNQQGIQTVMDLTQPAISESTQPTIQLTSTQPTVLVFAGRHTPPKQQKQVQEKTICKRRQ